MTDLDAYLQRHYRSAEQLAAACATTPQTLAELVRHRLVPAPSYSVCAQGRLHSAAFGEFADCGARPGDYFHPGNGAWVALALRVCDDRPMQAAQDELQARFRSGYAAALRDCDRRIGRLRDAFDDNGEPIAAGLDARTAEAWAALVDGIYSLCVADPSSERAIAEKEVLQETLTALHADPAASTWPDQEKARVRGLIDRYADAAMPFSPLEYPRSSRKRLVEDFRAALGARGADSPHDGG